MLFPSPEGRRFAEQQGRGLVGGAHTAHYLVEQSAQRLELGRRQRSKTFDEPDLGGDRGSIHQPLSTPRQPQLSTAQVVGGRLAFDQALLDQTTHDRGDGALVSVRTRSQLVDGAHGGLSQLLEHE